MGKPNNGKSATNEVFIQGYLGAAKGSEVLRRLTSVFTTLKSVEQADHEDLPPGLENVASDVIADAFMKSKSKVCAPRAGVVLRPYGGEDDFTLYHTDHYRAQEVRMLAASCIVEILRIYAPTPPYNSTQLEVRVVVWFYSCTLCVFAMPLELCKYGHHRTQQSNGNLTDAAM